MASCTFVERNFTSAIQITQSAPKIALWYEDILWQEEKVLFVTLPLALEVLTSVKISDTIYAIL